MEQTLLLIIAMMENTKKYFTLFKRSKIIRNDIFNFWDHVQSCYDCYGEKTLYFLHKNGYVDIGLQGDDISYHIRNDINPKKSVHADIKWSEYPLHRENIRNAIHLMKRGI